MTAELLVKLSAQLSAKQQDSVNDSDSDDSDMIALSTPDNESGGVPLTSPNSEGRDDSDTPPEWYAQRLNRSSIVVEGGYQGSGKSDESKPAWFIPPMSSSFWEPYINKLRVHAVADGVCELVGRDY